MPYCLGDLKRDPNVENYPYASTQDKCEGIAAVMEGHDVVNLVGGNKQKTMNSTRPCM